MNQKLRAIFLIGVAAIIFRAADVAAYEEFVAATGASGCAACHLDNDGNGYRTGVRTAYETGGIDGLIAFLNPDTKPQIRTINSKWDITVGEAALVIPLRVSDAEHDTFSMKGSLPLGAKFSKVYTDTVTQLPTVNFIWSPTADQADDGGNNDVDNSKLYKLSFTAKENAPGRTLSSNTVSTTIQVWPVRTSATKQVSKFQLQTAKWENSKLILKGQVFFKSWVTAEQRKAALANLTMRVESIKGAFVINPVKLSPQANGSWQKTLTLPTSVYVPCTVWVNYEGLNAARTVNQAKEICEDDQS